MNDLERSTFQNRPAYRYIRASDNVPTFDQLNENPAGPAMAFIKLFNPSGSWTWYINSYNPETRIAFGLVVGQETELGYFSMEELVSFRGRFGLPLERDLSFKPCPLSQLQAKKEVA